MSSDLALRPWPVRSLLLALCVALGLAACGGGEKASAPAEPQQPPAAVEQPAEPPAAEPAVAAAELGTVPAGAALAPATAPVFLSVNGDLDSAQWTAVRDLIARFPGGQEAWDRVIADIAGEGIDLETDVKPALGPELDVVLLDLPLDQVAVEGCLADASAGDLDDAVSECGSGEAVTDPKVVVLTKPADPAKTAQLLLKASSAGGDPPPASRTVDGWVLLAETEAILDEFQAGAASGTLGESARFVEAMQALPGDNAVEVYVDGAIVQKAIEQAAATTSAASTIFEQIQSFGLGTTEWIGVSLRAEAAGLRIDGAVKSTGATLPEPYAAKLPSIAPDGAYAYVSFRDLRTTVERALDLIGATQPELDRQIGQLEAFLGLSLDEDVFPLLEGEHALYVRAGLPIPEVTLLLSPADATAAVATVDKLVGTVNTLRGADDSTFTSSQQQIGEITARTLTFPQGFSLYYAAVGDNLVVTTAVSGIADLQAGGRLADSQAFQDALAVAGVPEETAGFVVVDIDQIQAFIDALPIEDVEPEARQAIAALGDVVFYSTVDDAGFMRVGGLVGVDQPAP